MQSDATQILDVYREALSLKLLPRTGWLQRGVAQPESVAEHSFGVALLALLVGATVPTLDRGRLLAMALLHDLAEARTGDLPRSAQRLLGTDAKRAMEHAAAKGMLAGLPDAHLALWESYTAQNCLEARLIKGLDRIELLAQALAYERAGHRGLGEFWEGAAAGWDAEFPILAELADLLILERQRIHA